MFAKSMLNHLTQRRVWKWFEFKADHLTHLLPHTDYINTTTLYINQVSNKS